MPEVLENTGTRLLTNEELGATNITNVSLSLGGVYNTGEMSGIIYSGGMDLGIGSGDSSHIIRSNPDGTLISDDVENYINAVNSGTATSMFRHDGGTADTSITGTNSRTSIYSDLRNNIESGNVYINSSHTNCVTWNTDSGNWKTTVGVSGTLIRNGIDGARESKRRKLKAGLTIITKSRAECIPRNIPENERIAIETLREEVSETEYRRYIKHGFVMVQGESGDSYQVFRNNVHIKVWRLGKVIEEVCVRISDWKIPPTDNVIAFKNIIQFSEQEFKKLGNVYKKNGSNRVRAEGFTGAANGFYANVTGGALVGAA